MDKKILVLSVILSLGSVVFSAGNYDYTQNVQATGASLLTNCASLILITGLVFFSNALRGRRRRNHGNYAKAQPQVFGVLDADEL